MLEKAIEIAVQAHKGQKDKIGDPYILHPLRVMMSVESNDEKIIAILHDVIEDTDLTVSDLKKHGFDESIIKAVSTLTKQKGEDYSDFISRVKDDPLAKRVKIADIKDNMQWFRLYHLPDCDVERLAKKYCSALKELMA